MEKHDHFFTPEHIDEQIEQRISDRQITPETRFLSEIQQVAQQIRTEHERSLERVEARIRQYSLTHVEYRPADLQDKQPRSYSPQHTLQHILQGRFNRMEKKTSSHPNIAKFGRLASLLVAILIMVVLVGGLVRILNGAHPSTSTGSAPTLTPVATLASNNAQPTPTATPTPTAAQPPTSVRLRVSVSGTTLTTSNLTIHSGTVVTLTVLPDHPLLPFQIFTMGIYATDPYGFSDLKDCQFPNVATCSYTIAYSASEQTDYTKGKHTFRAFLGNIGGRILADSSDVTITWS